MSKIGKIFAILGTLTVTAALLTYQEPSLTPEIDNTDIITILITLLLILILGLYSLKSFDVSKVKRNEIKLDPEEPIEQVKQSSRQNLLEHDFENEQQASQQLRKLVKQIIINEYGKSNDFAEKAIKNREWTNNKVSAAFIEHKINYPVLERFREWLEQDIEQTFERRLETTTKSIENLYQQKENT